MTYVTVLAQVDPDLHAASAHGGAGDSRAVVDLGTEGVQRHATLAVPLILSPVPSDLSDINRIFEDVFQRCRIPALRM